MKERSNGLRKYCNQVNSKAHPNFSPISLPYKNNADFIHKI